MYETVRGLAAQRRGINWGAAIVIPLGLLCSPLTALAGNNGLEQSQDADYTRVERSYRIPDVTLRDRQDRSVDLQSLLDDERPLVLQFIFTSCETVCPVLTAMAAQAQEDLRKIAAGTRIVSISLDPDYDTPERLERYAARFGAAGDWRFLTGDWRDIRKTLNAFNAMYEGQNKMYHKPYTFMRAASSDTWVRLVGLMGASTLTAEYRSVVD